MTLTVILAILGSNGLFALIQFLIKRYDEKKGKTAAISNQLAGIDKRMDKSERDSVRMQMLILMMHYPQEQRRIMELAHHYFVDLKGDWYMTGIFYNWLLDNNIGRPEWFDAGGGA